MIEITSLYKSYGNKKVLNDINITFKEGEVIGIIGENGAGKTTLFKCIAGLESHDGVIKYENGILKNTLGFLDTNPFFLSKMTGKEYIQLLINARGIKEDYIEKRNIFDLPLNQYADTYSTGMKKKLALTAILFQKNEVFILDEPFNGVDIQSNIIIQEIIKKLKELNKIVILSSHIFSTLNESCSTLHHLKNGEIVKSVVRNQFHEIEKDLKSELVDGLINKLKL